MKENKFQSSLISQIKEKFNGCVILKNDANYMQGIPDLLILHNNKWAMLEVKQSESAKHRPNQEHYIDILERMSFARFVYPENVSNVLEELEVFFN